MFVLLNSKHSQSNIFFVLNFFLLVIYGTLTERVEREIPDWIDVEVKLESAGQPSKQTNGLH